MNKPENNIEFIIPILPPTDNHLYGQTGHRRFMYKQGRDWKEEVSLLARAQNPKLIEGDVRAEITFYLKRERDIQGSLKVLFDALEGIIYNNDKQIVDFRVFKKFDKENPRVELIIKSL